MKRNTSHLSFLSFLLALATMFTVQAISQPQVAPNIVAKDSQPIPVDQLGPVATKGYQGDGLSVTATPDGARLRCIFQRLEGQLTSEGFWLSSTTGDVKSEPFRVRAVAVRREALGGRAGSEKSAATFLDWFPGGNTVSDSCFDPLPLTGTVEAAGEMARFIRAGLTEEYSVSVDGVRQDFIVEQRPNGEGALRVELDVTGANAEPLVNGARLVLDGSGRRLAYNRLRVVDARGQELTAHLEVTDATHLAVVGDDAAASYPVRIDPTFSDADWISMGGVAGANGMVRAAVVDGSGNLYIGGDFTITGDIFATNIAKWDGSAWSALGFGMNSDVLALAVLGTDLYAGGAFTTAGGSAAKYIAKWNGISWSALGAGMDSAVWALAVCGSDMYVGGSFTNATNSGGVAVTVNGIVKWNGSSWSALGSGMNSSVHALAVSGSDVYAGGRFTTATNGGGLAVTANGIVKWNGSSWSALGSGVGGLYPYVYALAVSGSDVYAGGFFTTAGGSTANRMAKWNGSSWSAVGPGMYGDVWALAISGSDLYAGGYFVITTTGSLAKRIAKWDGSNWSALGSGMGDSSPAPVFALAVSGSDVYAGGDFTTAGGRTANCIAKWGGSSWSALGSGIGGYVYALAVSGSDVYAGGYFTTAGPTTATNIAKWNGSSWSALGSGIDNTVYALAVSGSDVYAGGYFTTAGGSAANSIAKWNGSSWSALGSGIGGLVPYVYALALSGSDLYAVGAFTSAGGSAANYIAKWNGNSWSALGSGMNSDVLVLAVSGNDVYAGGFFTTAGGSAANRIAKWNGSSWSALGSGMNNNVQALAVSGSDVYAGGDFTTAGGISANRIAKWNGNSWSALGSGINGVVGSLVMSGSDVYAAGAFTTAGGVSASNVAKWDGSAWSGLASGVDDWVNALALSDTNLFAGGFFTTAGGKVSAYVAKASIGAARGRFSNLIYSPASGFSCTFLDASVGQPYRIQTSPSLAAGLWTDFTNFTYSAPIVISDPSAAATTNKFFRAITP